MRLPIGTPRAPSSPLNWSSSGYRNLNKPGQDPVLGFQLFARFAPSRIKRYALHGAYLLALWLIKMTHTFCALLWVNLIDFHAHIDRTVRALRLANVAIYALIGDHQGHRILNAFAFRRAFPLGVWPPMVQQIAQCPPSSVQSLVPGFPRHTDAVRRAS
jgi:hypothetical protein